MHTESSRNDFPITENYDFLNHAAVSPIARVAAEAIEQYARDSSELAMIGTGGWSRAESLRGLIATKIGCEPSEIAFCENVTTSIAFVAGGLDWQPGENVVLANVEFPANVYPWWAQKRRGVELKFVESIDGRLRLEDYFAAVDERTRVVTVSHVQFATGFRIDLDKLGAFCKDRGILLVVDAIQSCGALPVDVGRSNVSALAGGVHKWLLCPPGLSFFYCRKDLCEKLSVLAPGANSVVRVGEYLNYDLTYTNGSKRFEGGTISLPSAYALEAVLTMMNEVGEDQIQQKIKHLTDRLCAGVEERGYNVYSSRRDEEW